MWKSDDAPLIRLRERMRDAQAEVDKMQTGNQSATGFSATDEDVERVLLARDASRELRRILGSR